VPGDDILSATPNPIINVATGGKNTMHPLEKIFNPDSIAVIGASEVPGKASERRTRSLIEGGYQGKIYLINPKREQLFSRKAYPSILDADGPVDLVMIVVAPQFMVSAVSESIRIGAKGRGSLPALLTLKSIQ